MITLHKRSDGTLLTTISTVADRSWTMNDKGKCTLYMSVKDEKTIRRYMGERNLICISHPKLPLWGGVIETDQDWDDRGGVQFTAWSAESLWLGRTPLNGLTKASSPGALFESLVAIGNKAEDLRIRVGSIYGGGGNAETTLDGTNLLEVVKDLAERWDMEFDVTPRLDNRNTLSFEANWYARMGQRVEYLLAEGHNVRKTARPLKVTRRVVNCLTGFGEGSTDETRPEYTETDESSRELYGLMEGVQDYDGVVEVSTVKQHVQRNLRTLRTPKKIVNVMALDVEDTFEKIRKGNTLPFKAVSFGFRSQAGVGMNADLRVMAMRYLERANELEIKNQTEDFEL